MTDFDGVSWYSCPKCGNMVKANDDGSMSWESDVFAKGSKNHKSDFELADFSRGGDLTEG